MRPEAVGKEKIACATSYRKEKGETVVMDRINIWYRRERIVSGVKNDRKSGLFRSVSSICIVFIMVMSSLVLITSLSPSVEATYIDDDAFGVSEDFTDPYLDDWSFYDAGVYSPGQGGYVPPGGPGSGGKFLGLGLAGNQGHAGIDLGLTGRSDMMIEYRAWSWSSLGQKGEVYFAFYSLQTITNGGYAFKLTTVTSQFSQFVFISRDTHVTTVLGQTVNPQQLQPDTKYKLNLVIAGNHFYAFIGDELAAIAENSEYVTGFSSFNPYDIWTTVPHKLSGIDNYIGFFNKWTPGGVDDLKVMMNTIYTTNLEKWDIPVSVPNNHPQNVNYWRYNIADTAIELDAGERIELDIGNRPFNDFVFECDFLDLSNTGVLNFIFKYDEFDGSYYVMEVGLDGSNPNHHLRCWTPSGGLRIFGTSKSIGTTNNCWYHLKIIAIGTHYYAYLNERLILDGWSDTLSDGSIWNGNIAVQLTGQGKVNVDNAYYSAKSLGDDGTNILSFWDIESGNPTIANYLGKHWIQTSYDSTTTPATPRVDSITLLDNWIGYTGFNIEMDVHWKSKIAGTSPTTIASLVFGEIHNLDTYSFVLGSNLGSTPSRFKKNTGWIGQVEPINGIKIGMNTTYHLKICKDEKNLRAYIDGILAATAPVESEIYGNVGFYNDGNCEILFSNFNLELDTDDDGVLDTHEINGFDTFNEIGIFNWIPAQNDYAIYRIYLSTAHNTPVFCAKYPDGQSFTLKIYEAMAPPNENEFQLVKTESFLGTGYWSIYHFDYINNRQGELKFKVVYSNGNVNLELDWIGYRSYDYFVDADICDSNDEFNNPTPTIDIVTRIIRSRGQWEFSDYDRDEMSDRFEQRMQMRTNFGFATMYEDNWGTSGNEIRYRGILYQYTTTPSDTGIGPNSGTVLAYLDNVGQGIPKIRRYTSLTNHDYLIFVGPTIGTVIFEAPSNQPNGVFNDDLLIENSDGKEVSGPYDAQITNERYAILASIYDHDNKMACWFDIEDFRSYLTNQGYLEDADDTCFDPKNDHIATLWYDGSEGSAWPYGPGSNSYTPSNVDCEFSQNQLLIVLGQIKSVLGRDDSVVIYIVTHGDPAYGLYWTTSLTTYGYISETTLSNAYDTNLDLALQVTTVIMACSSGMFIDDLMGDNRLTITSCRGGSGLDSYSTDGRTTSTPPGTIDEGPAKSRSEFLYYFVSALDRSTPYDNDIYGEDTYVRSDANMNGYISIVEAFNYGRIHVSTDESPQYDDDGHYVDNAEPELHHGMNIYI